MTLFLPIHCPVNIKAIPLLQPAVSPGGGGRKRRRRRVGCFFGPFLLAAIKNSNTTLKNESVDPLKQSHLINLPESRIAVRKTS